MCLAIVEACIGVTSRLTLPTQHQPTGSNKHRLAQLSFKDLECKMPVLTHGERDVGFWVMLFTISKARFLSLLLSQCVD